jgi:small subunit ribosomal protein S19
MKKPFIEYKLYTTSFIENEKLSNTFIDNIKTNSRSSTIISKFIGKTFSIHNGKTTDHLTITPSMVGQKIGSFILTKKLGNSIHNSDNNRKKKEKARRKITQKKVRKTTVSSKKVKSSSSKKKK